MHRFAEQPGPHNAGLGTRGDAVSNGTASAGAYGEYERMLDDKGRVTIPPKVRSALGNDFVTARGASGSVLVIPTDRWPEIEARLRANGDSTDRYFQFAIHNYTRTSLDRQGRLKLPKHLLEWAAIAPGDAAAVIADGQMFEIWNKRAWMLRQPAPASGRTGRTEDRE